MKTIILASSSPRRKQLLQSLGIDFYVIPSNIEERMNPRLGAEAQAIELSRQKAFAIQPKAPKGSVILAADTIVELEGEQIGKPETIDEAKRMLRKQQGKSQVVVTGFTLLDKDSGKSVSSSGETKIWMRKLTPKEIENYVKKEHVLDKAGGYAIQGVGSLLIEKIEGDYFNVVGLPLAKIFQKLKKFGISIL